MTGEEIQRRLVDFARKWSLYDGSERAEAQTFLNELFACYGTDRLDAGARFEDPQSGKFRDPLRDLPAPADQCGARWRGWRARSSASSASLTQAGSPARPSP